MGRNRKVDRELRNTLDVIKESNQTVAENIGHTNEKLDDIKQDIKTIKKSITSKIPIIVAIITLIATIIGIVWKPKSEFNTIIDETRYVEQGENGSAEIDTDELSNLDPVEADNKEFSAYQKVIYFERNKFWDSKNIVGISYEPDSDLMKCITDAIDYSDDWDVYEPISLYQAEDTEGEKVALVGKTKNFLIYDIYKNNGSMLIKTYEDSYVLAASIPSTSMHKYQPSFMEADFDNDGDNELAIQILLRTGTGYSVDSLFMVDKTSNGEWYMFQFLIEDYIYMIRQIYTGTVIDGNSYFVWNGNIIDIPYKAQDGKPFNNYCIGDIVYIELCSEGIRIKLHAGYDWGHGMWEYSSGHGISAKVLYQDEGIWDLEEYDYYNYSLERYVTKAMDFYLTGDAGDVLHEYNFAFPVSSQVVAEYSIVEISYDSSKFGCDNFEVYIKYVVDHSDIIHHATFAMKQMDVDDLSDNLWKICDFNIIN